MEVILIIVVFWVVGKLLKAVFGGFSKERTTGVTSNHV